MKSGTSSERSTKNARAPACPPPSCSNRRMASTVADAMSGHSMASTLKAPRGRVRTVQERRNPLGPAWALLASSALAGLLTASSFAPFGLGWFAPIALGLLWLSVRHVSIGRAVLAGLAYGLSFMLVLLWWLSASLSPVAWIALGTPHAGSPPKPQSHM